MSSSEDEAVPQSGGAEAQTTAQTRVVPVSVLEAEAANCREKAAALNAAGWTFGADRLIQLAHSLDGIIRTHARDEAQPPTIEGIQDLPPEAAAVLEEQFWNLAVEAGAVKAQPPPVRDGVFDDYSGGDR